MGSKIGYVHAAGIDAPLSMVRNDTPIILHRNWRGTYDMATNTSGEPIHCMPGGGVGCDTFPWPGWSPLSYPYSPVLQETHVWYGSLALDQYDEKGSPTTWPPVDRGVQPTGPRMSSQLARVGQINRRQRQYPGPRVQAPRHCRRTACTLLLPVRVILTRGRP